MGVGVDCLREVDAGVEYLHFPDDANQFFDGIAVACGQFGSGNCMGRNGLTPRS